MAKVRKFADGGDTPDIDPLEEANKREPLDTEAGPRATSAAEPEPQTFKQAFAAARKAGGKSFTWNGKSYTTEIAKPASAENPKPYTPVPGRPRGESVGEPARRAPRFAADKDFDRNVAAAAVRNREAASEAVRESRRSTPPSEPPSPPKRKVLSMAGVNPKTMLPEAGYAKGGKVRGGGCEQRGKTRGKFI